MASSYLCLLLASLCVSYATAACEKSVVDKIKAVRQCQDDSLLPVVSSSGDGYDLVFVSGSSAVPPGFGNKTCQVSKFSKTKSGAYQVSHNGVLEGTYVLKNKDGIQLVIDTKTGEVLRATYVVYATKDYAVTAYYSCNISNKSKDVSAGAVMVGNSILKSATTDKLVKEAKDALAKVGLKVGSPITACY